MPLTLKWQLKSMGHERAMGQNYADDDSVSFKRLRRHIVVESSLRPTFLERVPPSRRTSSSRWHEQQVATRESTSRHLAQVREMRHRAISNLVEPENGFKIKCRLPSGDILQRKFTKEDPVSQILHPTPYLDIGLEESCLVNVSWVEPEEPTTAGNPQEDGPSQVAGPSGTSLTNQIITSGTPGVLFPVINQTHDSDDDLEVTLPVMEDDLITAIGEDLQDENLQHITVFTQEGVLRSRSSSLSSLPDAHFSEEYEEQEK
ncbi:hypothetical protein BSL78_16320 [Apostichopus japonicus]|uniref:Uncharacterized protein n=1 Tax=Stichopus japonicus TaxID=307972 RepID=A0A2G8KFN9_STIJA|nr:hypothetical protein BSL78_16320 [Apostichopus japonicus]